MKKETLFWLLTAAAAVVLAFVPEVGNSFFGVLALPFVGLGWCLRSLSLSGGVGNGVSILLYALICVGPVWLWLRSRRRREDWLLLLLPLELGVVLYYMVNPNLRPAMMQNTVGDAVYTACVFSTLVTWGVLKLLYSGEWDMERNIYKALRSFLLLCAASCLISCFGTGTAQLLNTLRWNRENLGQVYTGMDIVFQALAYLAAAVENGFAALVLYRGAKLLEVLERDPFGADCVSEANAVSALCRNALSIICLTCLTLNLAQILMTPLLHNISVSVTVPVMGLAVCFAMLAVTKLLVRGKELKDDNDLFV